MTREEAKEIFLNRGFIDGVFDGNKWRDACLVISKWLEQEPKADMVAMLTEIQTEIEELKNEPACCHHYKRGVNQSSDLIQQKIDVLKAESEDKE